MAAWLDIDQAAGILGIEGGGTKTTWARVTPDGRVLAQGVAGPGNTLLLSDQALRDLLRGIARDGGKGCRGDRRRVRGLRATGGTAPRGNSRCATRGPARQNRAGDGGYAVDPRGGVRRRAGHRGDCGHGLQRGGADLAGRRRSRRRAVGAIFSRIAAVRTTWRGAAWRRFSRGTMRRKKSRRWRANFSAATGLASLEELVPFLLRDTGKTAVAHYARCVFAAADQGDREARAVLDEAVGRTGREGSAAVARRLAAEAGARGADGRAV